MNAADRAKFFLTVDGAKGTSAIEPDSQEPLSYSTPTRPTPSHLASFAIWSEAVKMKDGRLFFGPAEILALLKRQFPKLKEESFIWERLVETIRLQCGMPFPHDKKRCQGSSRIWTNTIEYEGVFTIEEGWRRVEMIVKPYKEQPNQAAEPTPL